MKDKILRHPCLPARFSGNDALFDRLSAVAECLIEANRKFNLTAITDPDEIVSKHIVDSLIAADLVAEAAEDRPSSLIDIGSGAGFPSLPIAAALPHLNVTALDSTAKKCTYMNETAKSASIPHFRAISGRAEDLAVQKTHRDAYDFATARAVANLPVLLELCLPFVKVGGIFFALKGKNAPEEIKASENALSKLGAKLEKTDEYRIPGDDSPRYLLTIRKISPTPAGFPRHYSQISKKPL